MGRPNFRVAALLTGTVAILIVGGIFLFKPDAPASKEDTPKQTPAGRKKEARVAADKASEIALNDIMARWKRATRSTQSQELVDVKRELAQEAVDRVGGTDALLEFIELLKKEGQGDLCEWIEGEGMKRLFASQRSKEAREWLLELEDKKLRVSFCFGAGSGFRDPDFKDYLNTLGDPQAQSQLLTGYCANLAASDPTKAVQSFIKLKPAKVDFTGMKHVMAAIPPGADFVAISQSFPDDSKTLARDSRKALLQSWARSNPQAAADYVLANSKLVNPEQLGPVIETWDKQDRGSASAWTQGLAPGEYRDVATAALAERLADENPAQAWELAAKMSPTPRREKALGAVHAVWSKSDPKAANNAKAKMAPPKGEQIR